MSNINELIDEFGEQKSVYDPMKKQMEAQGNNIKAIMIKDNKSVVETEKFIATLSTRESESVDEDLLLSIIKEIGADECIKTKEYVDSDILEQMIYADKISTENITKLSKATITKTSYALTVKKKKEKK